MSKFQKLIVPVIILITLVASIYFWVLLQNVESERMNSIAYINGLEKLTGVARLGSAHEHADIKVYLDGKLLDLSQPEYQVQSKFIHVEGGDGDVVHKHANGVTLEMFFRTLGIKLEIQCIVVEGINYCNSGNKKLKMFINGKQSNVFEKYEFKDLDKIFITFGNETENEIKEQIKQ